MMQTMRSKSLAFAILPTCFLLVSGCSEERKPLLHPNVLLVLVDSLRADHVGGEASKTPNLDRLTDEGVFLETAISQSARSLPSIVSLLTSLPPEQHGVVRHDLALSSDAMTLAEVMNERGFATAAFVTGEQFARGRGLEQGFETFTWRHADAGLDPVREIKTWFDGWKAAEPTRPFFVFVQIPLAKAMETPKSYAKAVRDADARAGRVIDALDALSAENDTLVIVTSDRGHDFEATESLREAGVRIPMLFRFPSRLAAGGMFSDVARTMDIGPTIMMLARVRQPAVFGFVHPAYGLAMRDLTEVLVGIPPDKRIVVGGDAEGRSQSLRLGDHKLIQHRQKQGIERFEFYDLANDPAEQTNLFKIESKRAAVYRQKLIAWREICADRPSYATAFRPTEN